MEREDDEERDGEEARKVPKTWIREKVRTLEVRGSEI